MLEQCDLKGVKRAVSFSKNHKNRSAATCSAARGGRGATVINIDLKHLLNIDLKFWLLGFKILGFCSEPFERTILLAFENQLKN